MCKFIIKDKNTGEILLSKKYSTPEKAQALKSNVEKYFDSNKVEITVE